MIRALFLITMLAWLSCSFVGAGVYPRGSVDLDTPAVGR